MARNKPMPKTETTSRRKRPGTGNGCTFVSSHQEKKGIQHSAQRSSLLLFAAVEPGQNIGTGFRQAVACGKFRQPVNGFETCSNHTKTNAPLFMQEQGCLFASALKKIRPTTFHAARQCPVPTNLQANSAAKLEKHLHCSQSAFQSPAKTPSSRRSLSVLHLVKNQTNCNIGGLLWTFAPHVVSCVCVCVRKDQREWEAQMCVFEADCVWRICPR